MIPIYKFDDPGFDAALKKIIERGEQAPAGVEETVRDIISEVRQRGDAALFEYTDRFDRLALSAETLQVKADEIERAMQAVEPAALEALELAAERRVRVVVEGRDAEADERRSVGERQVVGRPLRAGRQGFLPVIGPDECGAGQGRRCR